MAHELTHVANRDVLVMTIAGFFATIAAYIVQFGFFFGGGVGRRRRRQPGFFVLLLVSVAVYVISFFLMQALSRYREFAADRGAGDHHRPPERARLGADEDLERHGADPAAGPARVQRAERVLHLPARRGKARSAGLFSTHPPMEKRIAALQRLEAQLQGARSLGERAWASSTSSPASASSRRPAPDRLFAMSTADVTLETELELTTARQGGDRLPAARHRRLRGHRHATWRRSCRAPATDTGTTVDRAATTASATAGWSCATRTSRTSSSASTRSRSALQGGGYGDRLLCAVFAFRDARRPARLLDLQLQARRLLPVRARRRRAAARQRARAAPQGPDRRRAAGRGRARALVPALGHPDLSRVAEPVASGRMSGTIAGMHADAAPRAARVGPAASASSVGRLQLQPSRERAPGRCCRPVACQRARAGRSERIVLPVNRSCPPGRSTRRISRSAAEPCARATVQSIERGARRCRTVSVGESEHAR